MSDSFELPIVNTYHHNMIKVGALETIIFDVERSTKITEEERSNILTKARECKDKAQALVDQHRAFEPEDRYLDNVEEIVARQELWAEYGTKEVMPEIGFEVFGVKPQTETEQRVARGEEPTEDLGLN